MNQPYPPQQFPPAPPVSAAPPPKNGLGTAGFVLGLIGLIFSFIPIIGVIAWPLVILGLVFSAVGFSRTRRRQATNQGLAIAGLALSAVGLVICIVWAAAFGNAASNVSDTPIPTGVPAGNDAPAQQQQAPAQSTNHTVVYTVSGSGKASNITYTTDGMTSMNQESNVKLPWSKTITLPADQALQMVSISAQGSSESSKVDVTITVDGQLVKEAHATGYGLAMANGNIGTLGG